MSKVYCTAMQDNPTRPEIMFIFSTRVHNKTIKTRTINHHVGSGAEGVMGTVLEGGVTN